MVHGAGGQQGRYQRAVAFRVTVAQQQDDGTGTHGGFGFGLEAVQRLFQRFTGLQVQVDQRVRGLELRQRQQLAQFALAQHRRVEHHLHGVVRRGFEHIAFRAQLGGQRHHDLFAQRVYRRVGHLREGLAEIVADRADLVRQHRERRVVAHRAGGFLLGFRQHAQLGLTFLARQLEQLLEPPQRRCIERFGRQRRIHQAGAEVGDALLEPGLERRPRLVDVINGVGVEQLPTLKIHREHLAGSEFALGDDVPVAHVVHAHLRGHHQGVVGGQQPARRAQAVAVERAGGVTRVAHHHAGRAVPGVGGQAVVLVEGGEVGILVFQRRGRRRDQDTDGLQQVHAAGQQQFQHVVQALRIRTLKAHQGAAALPSPAAASSSARRVHGPSAGCLRWC